MKQNIIKLIALYLLSIFLISCGTSNNDAGTNNNNNNNNNNNSNNTDDKNDNNNQDVVFTSSSKINVKENQLDAITLKATGDTPIVYSISGADSDSFSINSAKGIVVFKVKPDYESKTTYNFTAKAKDSKNSEDEQNVIISILDEDEIAPLFTSSNTLSIKENTLRVVIVKTKDESMVTYSITNEADGSKFDINAISGEITFKQAPDFESTITSYSLNVLAKDAKDNKSNQNINITIINIEDETKPIWTSPRMVNVFENQLDAITLKATDDSSTITYSIGYILPGTTDVAQANIYGDSNIFNVSSTSGKVTFKKAPDYENKKSYRFIATATDLEGNEATQNVIISILDVDEISPKWVSSNTVRVQENQLNALTLKATDKNKITYSISGDDSDKFDINNTNGVAIVSFKKAPDFEKKTSYSFTAIAKDSKENASTQAIKINIIDIVDEIPPVWVSTDTVSAQENQLNAITIKATDENTITYSISGEDSDSFNIDSKTGLITFKKHPNYELKPSYNFISNVIDKYENTSSQNTTINVTFVENLISTFRGHASSVHSLALATNENYIFSGSGDNTIKLWDINTGRLQKTWTNNYTNDILSIAINEKYIFIGSGDNTIKLLDINTAKLEKTWTGHSDKVHLIKITPNGEDIISAGGYQDKSIKLWNINTGGLKKTWTGHTGGIHSLAITPDGKYIASGSNDESIKLWERDTGRLIRTLTGHTSIVSSLAITPDGKYILSGSNDESIKLWEMNTGRLIRTFTGHNGIINSITITPNGKYALSGSGDHTLKLWNITTGTMIRTLKGHEESVSSTTITKDGTYAISGSWDKTLKVWDINVTK